MKENIYYIYQYYDPIRNEPFYIGTGHKNRLNFHLKRKDMHPITHRINWIRKQGKEPIISKLYENLEYEDAFTIEPFIIKEIGRKQSGEGTLLNLTDGGEGKPGCITSKITKQKQSIAAAKQWKDLTKIPKTQKSYKIKFPNGQEQNIFGLRKFCREHNISFPNILQNKHSKGFSIVGNIPYKRKRLSI